MLYRNNARVATYRTLSSLFTMTTDYIPKIKFYIETSKEGFHAGIVNILDVNFDRTYNGKTYNFGGDVYVNLSNTSSHYKGVYVSNRLKWPS